MEYPTGLSQEAALQRANCLAAAVLVADGVFDETPQQQRERDRLIREIAATDAKAKELALEAKNWVDRRAIHMLWAELWPRVQRELAIRKVKV